MRAADKIDINLIELHHRASLLISRSQHEQAQADTEAAAAAEAASDKEDRDKQDVQLDLDTSEGILTAWTMPRQTLARQPVTEIHRDLLDQFTNGPPGAVPLDI